MRVEKKIEIVAVNFAEIRDIEIAVRHVLKTIRYLLDEVAHEVIVKTLCVSTRVVTIPVCVNQHQRGIFHIEVPNGTTREIICEIFHEKLLSHLLMSSLLEIVEDKGTHDGEVFVRVMRR